uniref:3-polyprenyl-4-hydroxybenzoate carboxy-lyase UbiX n=1 Tax=uncultured bacterium contig00016 TaxID=1181507 RepID=A0A806KQ24_9BACT|nr:3-polyprenyl-4-hydroxybenzoate carboxy-lyase UbiX [uncultured bacterium contig00016]
MRPVILGITGASGSIYAKRFLLSAKERGISVEVIATKTGEAVLKHEGCEHILQNCKVHAIDDFFAPPATGSSEYAGMAILPCSMGTLGRIAAGTSDNLLIRAADVCLKENRPLALSPREMPLSEIHLENMLKLKRAGAVIIPACPHFYKHPKTIEDLADTVVERVFNFLHS